MKCRIALVLILGMPVAGLGAESAPAGKENTFSAVRGLLLSATVLSEMGIAVAPVEERRMSCAESAQGRVISTGPWAEVFMIVTAEAAAIWRPGFPATVDGLVGRVRSRRSGEVLVEVQDPDRRLRAGSFVPVRSAAVPMHGIVVAEASVVDRGSDVFVYVRNESALKRVPVKVGRRGGGWVEIVDGLLPGDEIATGDVAALWIAELRAVTAGGRCCPL